MESVQREREREREERECVYARESRSMIAWVWQEEDLNVKAKEMSKLQTKLERALAERTEALRLSSFLDVCVRRAVSWTQSLMFV